MLTLGLTGGIGSGKSTVAAMLARRGATIIDADQAGHRAYLPGTPGFDAVIARFGPAIVSRDGAIDRAALGRIVFADAAQLAALDAIVHPIIAGLVAHDLASAQAAGQRVAVLEAALLFDAGWERLCRQVWVTVAPRQVIELRLEARNGWSRDEIARRIAAQMHDAARDARADVIVETDQSLESLERSVERLWQQHVVPLLAPDRSAGAEAEDGLAQ